MFRGLIEGDTFSSRRAYYGCYAVVFLVFALAAFWFVFASGHSLIWGSDGLDQLYMAFVYMGQWIRKCIATGTLVMWDYNLGYGADVFASMESWISDPFNWLSAFCPTEYTAVMFQVLVFVRLFLAGVAFSAYCRYRKLKDFPVLCGAMVYTFCGFMIFWGAMRQTLFINAGILFPLVMLGVDKIFDGKSPIQFVAFVALSFMFDFYFAYMICLFVIMYCLLRYFRDDRTRSVRDFAMLVLRFVLYGLIAIAMACVFMLPPFMCLMGMDRLSSGVAVPIVNSPSMYVFFPLGLAGGDVSASTIGARVGMVACFCLVALLCSKKLRHDHAMQTLLIAFAVLLVFAFFPVVGHAFNGFSYNTDRWMFGLGFLMAYITVVACPLLLDLEKPAYRNLAIVTVLYIVLAAVVAAVIYVKASREQLLLLICSAALAAALMALVLVAKRRKSRALLNGGLALALVCSTASMCYFRLATPALSTGKAYIDSMVQRGTATDRLLAGPNDLVSHLGDGGLWRYDKQSGIITLNSSAVKQLMGIDWFIGFYNQKVDTFRTQLALPMDSSNQNYYYAENDSRAAVDAISGVKYYLVKSSNKAIVPYSFNTSVAGGTFGSTDYTVYRSDSSLPMAFTYDSVMSPAAYSQLNPLQRQRALLQACVVDDSSLPQANVQYSNDDIPYALHSTSDSGDATIEGNHIKTTKPNASVTIDFQGNPSCETYVYFDNLQMKDYRPAKKQSGDNSLQGKFAALNEDLRSTSAQSYTIRFDSNVIKNRTMIADTNRSNFYGGKHTWMVNLGYSEKPQSSVKITFDVAGIIPSIICRCSASPWIRSIRRRPG